MQVPGEPRPTAYALDAAHLLKRLLRLAATPFGGQLFGDGNLAPRTPEIRP